MDKEGERKATEEKVKAEEDKHVEYQKRVDHAATDVKHATETLKKRKSWGIKFKDHRCVVPSDNRPRKVRIADNRQAHKISHVINNIESLQQMYCMGLLGISCLCLSPLLEVHCK